MPKASFVFLSGEKYCDDFIFDDFIKLNNKLNEIYSDIKDNNKNNKFMYIKMILGEINLMYNKKYWFYCDYLKNINENITIMILKINLLEYIDDTKNEEIIKNILIDNYEDSYIELHAEYYSTLIKNDIIAEVAILNYPIFLKYANDKFKNNENLVLQCIYKNFETFTYISNKLKNNRDFIQKAVKMGRIYQYINDEFKKDKKIIHIALSYRNTYFNNLPDEIKNDKDYVLKLINHKLILDNYYNDFNALSSDMKRDKDIIIACIKNEILKIKYFDKNILFKNGSIEKFYHNKDHDIVLQTILNDRDILFEFVKKDSAIFDYIDDRYIDDIEMIKIVVINNPHLIRKVSDRIKKNRNLIMCLVTKNSEIIKNKDIHKLYCNDREIMLKIIENNVELFSYASKNLKNDEELKSMALEMYLKAAKNKFQIEIIEKETLPMFGWNP